MIKDVIVDIDLSEVRLAVLEDDQLVEMYVEKRAKKSPVGNIYRGKVERVLPGMQAAFVDIGLDKSAVLYVKDVCPINYSEEGEIQDSGDGLPDIADMLSQGEEISVQVIKDSTGSKGARVTTRLSMAGYFAVMIPHGKGIGVSKKIEDHDERKRLRRLATEMKPDNAGIIMRTNSENIPEEQIIEDIEELKTRVNELIVKEQRGSVPRLIYAEPDIVTKAVREYLNTDTNRFVINDPDEYERILSLLEDAAPELKKKITYFSKDYELFEYYHVESALREALSRKVWLKSGAYLVFDRTEALTVVDVNSGKCVGKTDFEETAYKINLEAAEAIAVQIRLRNLSGIIMVDFIDMHQKEHRDQLVQKFREAVKADKTQTVVVDMTSLGLVEITRKKVHQPLYKSFTVDCTICRGAGYHISPEVVAHRFR